MKNTEGKSEAGILRQKAKDLIKKQVKEVSVVSETRFGRLSEQAADGIIILDAHSGKIFDLNPFFIELSGYSKEQFIGKAIWEINFLKDIAPDKAEFKKLKQKKNIHLKNQPFQAADGRCFNFEFTGNVYILDRYIVIQYSILDLSGGGQTEQKLKICVTDDSFETPDGIQYFDTKFAPEYAADGTISSVQTISRDITSHPKIEEAIHRQAGRLLKETRLYAAGLEERVNECTAKLEAANKELETFSYSVSHDLRAPLRHIGGFIRLFLECKSTELTDEELGYLNIVSQSAEDMGSLIDALLSYSRLNRTELRKLNLDTLQLIHQGIELFDPEINERGIRIVIGDLPETYGDLQLMRQVWVNLISNAVKFTGKKNNVLIEIGSYDKNNERVFFIKDNGAGFNMKYVGKLFGVFQRLHKVSDFEGTGIGLANVNRIITRHGGRCWAEGETNIGATFYFSLPNESIV